MEKVMAVISAEHKYAERLCNYINHKDDRMITAVPFGSVSEYRDFEHKGLVRVVLCDDALVNEYNICGQDTESRRKQKSRLLVLTGNMYLLKEHNSYDPETINKYQSADDILREVIRYCTDIDLYADSGPNGKKNRIIGVYSPIGRSGKTIFAMTLCKKLSKFSKTLYVNFDEFSGLRTMMDEQSQQSLSDAVYQMQKGKLTGQQISALVHNYKGIDYIPPVRFAEDLPAADGEGYADMIRRILAESRYETVVADINTFAGMASDMLDMCDVIYMPVLDDAASRDKLREFDDYLEFSGRSQLAGRIIRIHVPEPAYTGNRETFVDSLMFGPVGDLVNSLSENGV